MQDCYSEKKIIFHICPKNMKYKQHMKIERETVLREYVLSLFSGVSLCIMMCGSYCCAVSDGENFDICMFCWQIS